MEACAADVLETLLAAGVEPERDELVVCGHSFGGKVALAVLRSLLESGTPPPRTTWLFDSMPGRPAPRSTEEERAEQSVSFVLGVVEAAASPGLYADRSALVDALASEHGLAKPLAQWVAQGVKPSACGGGVRLGYDVGAVRAMYDSYQATDMWQVLEAGTADIGIVVAGRNRHAWGDENLSRLDALRDRRVQTAVLEGAGHNVHVDDLPGLLKVVEPSFV